MIVFGAPTRHARVCVHVEVNGFVFRFLTAPAKELTFPRRSLTAFTV